MADWKDLLVIVPENTEFTITNPIPGYYDSVVTRRTGNFKVICLPLCSRVDGAGDVFFIQAVDVEGSLVGNTQYMVETPYGSFYIVNGTGNPVWDYCFPTAMGWRGAVTVNGNVRNYTLDDIKQITGSMVFDPDSPFWSVIAGVLGQNSATFPQYALFKRNNIMVGLISPPPFQVQGGFRDAYGFGTRAWDINDTRVLYFDTYDETTGVRSYIVTLQTISREQALIDTIEINGTTLYIYSRFGEDIKLPLLNTYRGPVYEDSLTHVGTYGAKPIPFEYFCKPGDYKNPASDLYALIQYWMLGINIDDFMNLNTPGNSEQTNAVYQFVNPMAGLAYNTAKQIKINWTITGASKNPLVSKETTFNIPINAHCFVLFTGKYVGVYCDKPGVTMEMNVFNNKQLIGTVTKQSDIGLLEVQDIFGMYEGYEPVGGTYDVKIYTPFIFIRQIYKCASRDQLPQKGDPTYEIFQPGTSSAYVNPNDTGELASVHLLSFNSIADMKAASDAKN